MTTHYNHSVAAAKGWSIVSGVVNDRSRRVERVTQKKEEIKVNHKSNRTIIDGQLYEYRYADVLNIHTSIDIELHQTGKIKSATYRKYTIKTHYKIDVDANGEIWLVNPVLDGAFFEDARPVGSGGIDPFLQGKLNAAVKYNGRGWAYPTGGVEVGPIIDPLEYSNEAEKTMEKIK